MPSVEFEFHAQRSPVVLDRLRSGEYMVGICTGSPDADTDLVSEVIRQEPMVIIPSGLKPLKYRIWRSVGRDDHRVALRSLGLHRGKYAAA